jgi:hypothetical protein
MIVKTRAKNTRITKRHAKPRIERDKYEHKKNE